MTDGQQLLAQYRETGSETAFRELVTRYVNLVYSAAVRLVDGDTHRAEDVTQTVFADLARKSGALEPGVMVGGWLHRHTCFVASNVMRGERRRQARERQAVEMNAMDDHSAANLAQVAPVLDEAIDQLEAEDRAAIMLRYFEQHDFRAVGAALGTSDEAARKRVDRALEKLESLLKRRGVALSAAALGSTLAAQAVTAAPAGLATSIAGSVLAGAAAGGGSTLTILKIMSMSKLKIALTSAVIAAAIAVPWVMQQQTAAKLREANDALAQQAKQISRLTTENEEFKSRKTTAAAPKPSTNTQSLETLRLRGEVGRLREENVGAAAAVAKVNGPSALSGIRANPEMWKMIRDQQKMGMTFVYKGLTNYVNLSTNQVEQLNDLLADNVMENIDRITEVLRDKKTPAQAEEVFAAQEAAMLEKVQSLLGPEALAQYKNYTGDLVNTLTAEQFKDMMTGDKAAKDDKSRQLLQLMQEETRQTLASAGLPPDFQLAPTLNFRNFAFESEGEKNLKLLEGIYERVADRAKAFLGEKDQEKFAEFRAMAINGNRMGLTLNRKMMAPGSN